jgi:hypothetical protein
MVCSVHCVGYVKTDPLYEAVAYDDVGVRLVQQSRYPRDCCKPG